MNIDEQVDHLSDQLVRLSEFLLPLAVMLADGLRDTDSRRVVDIDVYGLHVEWEHDGELWRLVTSTDIRAPIYESSREPDVNVAAYALLRFALTARLSRMTFERIGT